MNAIVDRTKLARVLGMLGSTHDGEVLAAARQAERLRQGRPWIDLLSPGPGPRPDPPPMGWRQAVALCQAYPDRLTPWERDFVQSIAGYRCDPTDRQRAVLTKIAAKVAA
jgi:hypothetical protein